MSDWSSLASGSRVWSKTVLPACGILLALTATSLAQWPQFGGPNRDFTVDSASLSASWPEGGPRELWSKEFGDGFSSILVEGGHLYTMRRQGDSDVVVCLNAGSGDIVWETSYPSPTAEGMILDFGPGPISTPLISGSRLFTVSSTVKLHALDKASGSTWTIASGMDTPNMIVSGGAFVYVTDTEYGNIYRVAK